MSNSDLYVPSSTPDLVSPSCKYTSTPESTRALQAAEYQLPSIFGVANNEIEVTTSDVSVANISANQFVACESNKKIARDRGWWLILDMFVRQERWSQLAVLEASSFIFEPQEQQRSEAISRILDILVALFLLILLMPALLIIVICVRLDSRGSAMFSHSRVGKGGAEFKLWKVRSMRIDALKYERSPTSTADPRLTWIGKVIRRISFDEIPQLVNVLKGEMSLVGPRPEMAFIANHYSLTERRRLLVKPGITGLWQISSGRAAPIHHNLQYDFYYIQHKNIMLDIAILLRTITAVIRGIGAI
jgi:lipopolysaccharide/colanic/teichoic acid biosynthesis glycosyltransferase